jgi:uncharacterized repeat protein (TIGR01451 family)
MNKHNLAILTLFLLTLIIHIPHALAVDKTTVEFPLEVGGAVYFEDGHYKVKLVSTKWDMGWAVLNITCEGCLYEPRKLYGRQNETVHYPGTDNAIISITNTRSVTKDTALVTISFPKDWSFVILTAKEVEEKEKPVTVPKLEVTKTVDKTTVKLNDIIQVKITVKNTGNGSAQDIDIKEMPSTALIPLGEELKPKIKDPLPPGESDFDTYLVQAVKNGSFTLPKTIVTYYSESGKKYTGESNILTVKVLAPEVKHANLTTSVQFDKPHLLKGEETTVTITIKNEGDAPARNINIINKLPIGLELINGDLEDTYFEIKPGETRELRAVIKAKEVGNYTLEPRVVYSDGETITTSPTIIVTKKVVDYKKYAYLIPIALIIILIIGFIIKRHREYSF